TASTSDPDGDRVQLKWASVPGPCDPQALPVPAGGTSPTFTVTPMTDADGMMCVVAYAVDRYGATSQPDFRDVNVANNPPEPHIDVLAPTMHDADQHYDLYSTFVLSAGGSRDLDGDPLTFTWALVLPDGGKQLMDCEPATSPPSSTKVTQCLGPIVKHGHYQVTLTANDGRDSRSTTLPLDINDDRAPCIAGTSPDDPTAVIDWDPTVAKDFEVLN